MQSIGNALQRLTGTVGEPTILRLSGGAFYHAFGTTV